jgi:hypothetical protein
MGVKFDGWGRSRMAAAARIIPIKSLLRGFMIDLRLY